MRYLLIFVFLAQSLSFGQELRSKPGRPARRPSTRDMETLRFYNSCRDYVDEYVNGYRMEISKTMQFKFVSHDGKRVYEFDCPAGTLAANVNFKAHSDLVTYDIVGHECDTTAALYITMKRKTFLHYRKLRILAGLNKMLIETENKRDYFISWWYKDRLLLEKFPISWRPIGEKKLRNKVLQHSKYISMTLLLTKALIEHPEKANEQIFYFVGLDEKKGWLYINDDLQIEVADFLDFTQNFVLSDDDCPFHVLEAQ